MIEEELELFYMMRDNINYLMDREVNLKCRIDALRYDVDCMTPMMVHGQELNSLMNFVNNLCSEVEQLKREIGHLNVVVGEQRKVIEKYKSIVEVHSICDSIAEDIGGKDRKWTMC